jgi:hypothetical protein
MTVYADLLLDVRTEMTSNGAADPAKVKAAWAGDRKSMIVFQDRLFIAKKLQEKHLSKRWHDASIDFLKNGDTKKFGIELNEIKAIIIDIAVKG